MTNQAVLVIGSGGREHALVWKLFQSPQVGQIYVAPGNAGTAELATNLPVASDNIPALTTFASKKGIDLTIVGPEAPLAAGIVDHFQSVGLPIFGPTRAAAQLEASKAFAKQFMREEGIPTADYAIFTNYDQACSYLQARSQPVVIKASGLAAGKGVIMCRDRKAALAALDQVMVQRAFGAAGDTVVIEEWLQGPELSLLAFSDGRTIAPMLPARDHKRAYDNDEGPNTGGMGVYAPPPDVDAALTAEIVRTVLQPAVDGMARRGTPYVGALYAGVMLTRDGPKTLEFNCRFGDPETQVILPMLDADLFAIMGACVAGELTSDMAARRKGACASVVMAAPGYPGNYPRGMAISGLDTAVPDHTVVFHAGTKQVNGRVVTDGGRVLAVSAWGDDLETAVRRAYAGIAPIHFDGAFYRKDIGRNVQSAYVRAGVDIAAGQRAVELMKTAVQSTFGPQVLSDVGAFGGLYAADDIMQMAAPVLVASTDGVGSKTQVAARLNRWETIGHDIVNHCVNDILAQGARPLFFLDYVASARINPDQIAAIVAGIAEACKAVGCALLGGETAEMPGVYHEDAIDLVGTVVGVTARQQIIDGTRIQAGDVILGLPSSGLHTNGYTLARAALDALDWMQPHPDLGGQTPGDALLTPHRCYLDAVQNLQHAGVDIRGVSHITGGGLIDNPPRIFPNGLGAIIRRGDWPQLPIFALIQCLGGIPDDEMFHVFNMGLGMLITIPPEHVSLAQETLRDELYVVGEMVKGTAVSIQK